MPHGLIGSSPPRRSSTVSSKAASTRPARARWVNSRRRIGRLAGRSPRADRRASAAECSAWAEWPPDRSATPVGRVPPAGAHLRPTPTDPLRPRPGGRFKPLDPSIPQSLSKIPSDRIARQTKATSGRGKRMTAFSGPATPIGSVARPRAPEPVPAAPAELPRRFWSPRAATGSIPSCRRRRANHPEESSTTTPTILQPDPLAKGKARHVHAKDGRTQ